jgi:hypothetical protein
MMLYIIGSGHGAQPGSESLIDRSVEEGLLDDVDVGAAAGIKAQPLLLKGAREADQRDKSADGHANSAQGERGSQTPAPEILPGKSYE